MTCMPLMDNGHYHPLEYVSDKIPAMLCFYPEFALHITRGVRWDSDHVLILDDETKEMAKEIVRDNALDRVYMALDYFDASINRIGAYIVGTRATQKSVLSALLEPLAKLREYEDKGQWFERLALLEEAKSLPFGAVYDYFNMKHNIPVGEEFIADIQQYEKDVLSKRADGYHNISTVMQAVDLYDTITITDNESGTVTISCNCEGVPCDDSNICAKAAYKFFDYCKTDVKGIHIDIDKKIPTQAGLAGGSSDGAAVILGLNNMFGTMLKPAEMREIGEKVGADVPFCLEGGTKLCTGIGTAIKKVASFRCDSIVICKPDTVSVSTADAYKKVDALNPHACYTDEMVKALFSRDMFMISTTIFNDFELALQIPEVNEIKGIMLKSKARGAGMSGSGSAVFGVFTSSRRAKKCYDKLCESYKEVFLCKPVSDGCKVL